jgi:hypothetical protein
VAPSPVALLPFPPRVQALGAAVLCLVIAVAAGLAVDSRLDRHWWLRGLTLLLALGCAALLLTESVRRLRQIITLIGLAMFGLIIPVSQTTWSKPPEIEFALQVATDAAAKANSNPVTVADVKSAAESRGGAIGSLKTEKTPEIRGAAAYPVIVRAKPDQGRPWACISFTGRKAEVRPC